LRNRTTAGLCSVAVALAITGAACRQDMHDQPKVEAYEAAEFFADGRGMREIPEGTIARGHLRNDELLYTGKTNGQLASEFPFPVTRDVLRQGQERYNIYCSPCHGATGMGNGMVVQRGYRPPPSFHSDLTRNRPVGHFVDVMTNGFGAMPDYRAQVSPRDRWAITAYIKALQLSQRATVADVPEDRREELGTPEGAAPQQAPPAPDGGGH
jgi:mono/diheme cytochrome c family protein